MCDQCNTAREFSEYRLFNPACIFCGARLIQLLGKLPIAATECTRRRKAALADWVEWGHNEQQIRSLVKGVWCIGLVKALESGPQTTTKLR